MKDVFVAHQAVTRCEKFAMMVSTSHKFGGRRYGKSYAVDRRLKEIGNHSLEYVGRVSEYALCLELGIDPINSLDWNTRKADVGFDIRLPDGRTIDVKSSDHPGAYRLIWPVTKRQDLFRAADFFVLTRVLKSRREALGQTVEIMGCVTKARFIAEAITANNIRGLVDGTMFMEKNRLDDIATLRQTIRVD